MFLPGTHLSFPTHILRGVDALNQLGPILDTSLDQLFVVGGKTALTVVMPRLQQLMQTQAQWQHRQIVQQAWYGGEVSQPHIDVLVAQVKASHANVVIAVGGGKALDIGKAVAQVCQLPVVMIPTIAATCAAVSTVSVLYDESGHYIGLFQLDKAPDIVVLDPVLIATAPVRWLSAGLGDTLAKLYEYRVISGGEPDYSLNMAAFAQGKLCFQLIERFGGAACGEVMRGEAGTALEQVMDAIFIYAGFTSIMGVGDHVAAAHALFDGFTVLDKTREFGHGLLVGYGNLCLLALEGRSDAEILAAIQLAKQCGIPVSLHDIAPLDEAKIDQIIAAAIGTPDMANMPFPVTASMMRDAMARVDRFAVM
jgi:glycerol dehydrogenase-like iron-containing ADH family enzyme